MVGGLRHLERGGRATLECPLPHKVNLSRVLSALHKASIVLDPVTMTILRTEVRFESVYHLPIVVASPGKVVEAVGSGPRDLQQRGGGGAQGQLRTGAAG
jgi:hypothetical protein